MRRLLSILLVALFWAGPVAALLPGSDEAQLPACCRRHGSHHCMMSMLTARVAADKGLAFSAPLQCLRYPHASPATAAVFMVPPSPQPAQAAESRASVRPIRAAVVHRAFVSASRGPPALG